MADQTPTVGMACKLAAIFSTDVAGYSRLMGEDEEVTIRTLTLYRALISSLIQQYRGRVIDAPGDNLLLWADQIIFRDSTTDQRRPKYS